MGKSLTEERSKVCGATPQQQAARRNPGSCEVQAAAYEGYLARQQQLPSSAGDGTSCSLETDDDGTYLWAQDHDNNVSTPLASSLERTRSPSSGANSAVSQMFVTSGADGLPMEAAFVC